MKKSEKNIILYPQFNTKVVVFRVWLIALILFFPVFVVTNLFLVFSDITRNFSSLFLIFIYPIILLTMVTIIRGNYKKISYLIGDNELEITDAFLGFDSKSKILFNKIKEVNITCNPVQKKEGLSTLSFLLDSYDPSKHLPKRFLDIREGDEVYQIIMDKIARFNK